jgi:hypothetical protein
VQDPETGRLGCWLAGGVFAEITDLDPLQYNLLFEAVPEPRSEVSIPDFTTLSSRTVTA